MGVYTKEAHTISIIVKAFIILMLIGVIGVTNALANENEDFSENSIVIEKIEHEK